MTETKWPVGSVHPVYGKVAGSFYIEKDQLHCRIFDNGSGTRVFVTEQGLDVAAELHSLLTRGADSDLIYDTIKTLPPETLDEIEHMLYVIHQENNHNYPEI